MDWFRFSFQIKNVRDHRKENRMESFFLAETTKYLYLLFDPDNFLNNDGSGGTVIQMLNGECVIDTGSYIFNTEAHPIDSAALRCCHEMPYTELITENFTPSNYLGETMELKIDDKTIPDIHRFDEFVTTNQEDLKEFGYKVTEWLTESDDDKSELLKFIDEIKSMSGKTSSQKNPLLVNLTDSNGSTIASTQQQEQQQQQQQQSSDMSYDDLILFDELLAAEVNKTATNFDGQTTDDPQRNRTAKIITQTTTASSSSSPSSSSSQSWQETANANDDEKSKLTDDVIRPIPSADSVAENVPRRAFDAQKLLEQIRKVNDGVHVVPNYEMLTCKSQSFLQRLAVLGEMLT